MWQLADNDDEMRMEGSEHSREALLRACVDALDHPPGSGYMRPDSGYKRLDSNEAHCSELRITDHVLTWTFEATTAARSPMALCF